MEARFLGRPAVALSLAGENPVHYDAAARATVELVQLLMRNPDQQDLLLNINFPDVPYEEYTGWEVTRLGHRHKSEPAVRMQDPKRRTVYWVGPVGPGQDAGPGTDFHAVARNAISVTPMQVDLTRHGLLVPLAELVSGLNHAKT